MPACEFTEASALGAATIAWNRGNHRQALGHYETLEEVATLQSNQLEAAIGQMRCHYLLGQESEASDFAARVMYDPATPEDIRRTAKLWNARIACNQGLHATVMEDLEELVKFGGSPGAEAQYLIAEKAFNEDAFDACEQALFTLIETSYEQETWRNKGFLLLVSTYLGMNDLFQARATAESILANVSTPSVQEAVSDLLLTIDAREAAERAPIAQPDTTATPDSLDLDIPQVPTPKDSLDVNEVKTPAPQKINLLKQVTKTSLQIPTTNDIPIPFHQVALDSRHGHPAVDWLVVTNRHVANGCDVCRQPSNGGKRRGQIEFVANIAPLSVSKPILSYELLSRRMQFVPQMTPVEATRLRVDPSLSRLYRGYVRAGGGSRGTSMVDASYTDLRSRDGSWGTAFHHAATNSPSALLTGRLNENTLDAWVSRFVGKEKMSFEASAGSEQVLMYGFDSLQVDSALTPADAPVVMWSHATLGASFKSHKNRDRELNHEIDATLGWLRNDRGAHERSVSLNATLDKAFGEARGQLDVEVQLDEYGAGADVTSNQAIVVVEPSVSTQKGAIHAKAGLGLAIDADQPTRDGLGDAFHLYPQG